VVLPHGRAWRGRAAPVTSPGRLPWPFTLAVPWPADLAHGSRPAPEPARYDKIISAERATEPAAATLLAPPGTALSVLGRAGCRCGYPVRPRWRRCRYMIQISPASLKVMIRYSRTAPTACGELIPAAARAAIRATSTTPRPNGVGLKVLAPAPAPHASTSLPQGTGAPTAAIAAARHNASAAQLSTPQASR